jgi:AraC-like DNA-binding protein
MVDWACLAAANRGTEALPQATYWRRNSMHVRTRLSNVAELSWLSQVSLIGPHLTPQSPIAVRRFTIRSGPALAHPECHAYCELGLHTSGSGVEFIEREQGLRQAGDLLIAGPGVPHWFTISQYPLVGTAIYFLPSVLCEMGPISDGLQILRRFTAKQTMAERLVRPPAALRKRLRASFDAIHQEFEAKALGHEMRLRSLLMEMLVDVVRWESREGSVQLDASASRKWEQVNQTLRYLRDHFAEPIYARDIARAIGVSETRLKELFRETLGVRWSHYVRGYRIQQAVALLNSSDYNVTQVAMAVGFESLSHFDNTFREFMGMTPRAYLKQQPKSAKR